MRQLSLPDIGKWLKLLDKSWTKDLLKFAALINPGNSELDSELVAKLSGFWTLAHEPAEFVPSVEDAIVLLLFDCLFIAHSVSLLKCLACFVLVGSRAKFLTQSIFEEHWTEHILQGNARYTVPEMFFVAPDTVTIHLVGAETDRVERLKLHAGALQGTKMSIDFLYGVFDGQLVFLEKTWCNYPILRAAWW